ncbi:molybdate ABC transporter substrate-binding protein [Promineifilum sp.]|uniref:molybdate ABC transporter substrate-binding protein n=1 Tax=Promineifilum sp. TaxID=2664178 RepID=UPI0035AF1962
MVCCLLVLLTGCGRAQQESAQATAAEDAVTLTVFAAASLTDAFGEIKSVFQAANPGVTVAFNFAGSNQLATQIGEGAPADVFASANAAQMDAAVESGRIDADAAAIFATNRLVVVYPADNPAGIAALPDLAAPDTLIVLAAEEVPAGRYSLEFLNLASADPALGASFKEAVLGNVASYEENVRSVLNKVSLGEADAGIVYASDLIGVEDVASLEIPGALNVVAEYPIASLNDSAQAEAAAGFIALLLSDKGQTILANYGFGPIR